MHKKKPIFKLSDRDNTNQTLVASFILGRFIFELPKSFVGLRSNILKMNIFLALIHIFLYLTTIISEQSISMIDCLHFYGQINSRVKVISTSYDRGAIAALGLNIIYGAAHSKFTLSWVEKDLTWILDQVAQNSVTHCLLLNHV
ncbi:putative transcription factor Ovo-like 1 [Platysternon megacephalum]|uniref:Putative transcription factor Ovo-like 1 n=1 Tax=Platysternon megacephalum TaxID=55544 RepID=A0A4D9F351_9SAUR|nr:putative transcription factor Ovo-like 1 [Platysternon megacephalum]